MDYDFGWFTDLLGPLLGMKLILVGISLPLIQSAWLRFRDRG